MGKLKALDPIVSGLVNEMCLDNTIGAMVSFITDKVEPPYSIAVEGAWGSGKTTTLLLLEEQLRSLGYPTLLFNPWEYERTSDDIVLAFQQQIELWIYNLSARVGKIFA